MATLRINGRIHEVDTDPQTPLLLVLRNYIGLTATKYGCGLGQCGACTVHVDGSPVRSCVTPVRSVEGREVTTLEGLGNRDQPHPLQTAFIEKQAMQCGYCTSGMIMSAAAILADDPDASEATIRERMARNLCRCGSHPRILSAIRHAKSLRS